MSLFWTTYRSVYPRANQIIDITANINTDTAAGITPRRRAFVIRRSNHDDNFCCRSSYGIHLLYPKHLIFRFERFGNATLFGKFFYQPKEHISICSFRLARQPLSFPLRSRLLYIPLRYSRIYRRCRRSRLSARSVLLPSAEVSTGHPYPHTPMGRRSSSVITRQGM